MVGATGRAESTGREKEFDVEKVEALVTLYFSGLCVDRKGCDLRTFYGYLDGMCWRLVFDTSTPFSVASHCLPKQLLRSS